MTRRLFLRSPQYPVNVTDPVSVLDYYKNLNVSTEFFSNILAMQARRIQMSWNKLGKPYNRGEWIMVRPQVSNMVWGFMC